MIAQQTLREDSHTIMNTASFEVKQGNGDLITRLSDGHSDDDSDGDDTFLTPDSVPLDSQLLQALDVNHLELLRAHRERKMSSQKPSLLALHSPSEIIGTPFATTTTRYEYPFPDSSSDTSSSPELNSQMSPPFFSTPSTLSQMSTSVLPPHLLPPAHFNHPKLLLDPRDPPVPPGLIKKKHRWTLGLVGRRRSERMHPDSEASRYFDGGNFVKRSFSDETHGDQPSIFGETSEEIERSHLGLGETSGTLSIERR